MLPLTKQYSKLEKRTWWWIGFKSEYLVSNTTVSPKLLSHIPTGIKVKSAILCSMVLMILSRPLARNVPELVRTLRDMENIYLIRRDSSTKKVNRKASYKGKLLFRESETRKSGMMDCRGWRGSIEVCACCLYSCQFPHQQPVTFPCEARQVWWDTRILP